MIGSRGFLVVLIGILSACASPVRAPAGRAETVVILATNDIHGELSGLVTLSGYVKQLREEYGDRLIWLDGGDQFQGSFESNREQGAPVTAALNAAGLTVASVGNHEFDFGLDALKARIGESKFPYAAANLVEKSTGRLPEIKNLVKSTIVQAGSVKVGVLGLSTETTPQTTRADLVASLRFEPILEATVKEARRLKDQGAELVVLVGHIGISCKPGAGGEKPRVLKPETPQGPCNESDEIYQLLRTMPRGTVDAAVGGHNHAIAHHWVNGVPAVQSGSKTKFFTLIRLNAEGLSEIEGPIPVETGSPVFHGVKVTPDPKVEAVVKPVLERAERIKAEVVGRVARPMTTSPSGESELGNLSADAIARAAHADVALVNPFSIRVKEFPAGELTFGQVFSCFPFDNLIVRAEVNGRELRDLVRNAESGAMGFFSVAGLRVKIDRASTRWTDRDGNGKQDQGEADHLESVQLVRANGVVEEIVDDGKYSVAMADFLYGGGDFMGWSTEALRAKPERVDLASAGLLRDAVLDFIRMKSKEKPEGMNTVADPLVNPKTPRIND